MLRRIEADNDLWPLLPGAAREGKANTLLSVRSEPIGVRQRRHAKKKSLVKEKNKK